eukprot:TRINITY_DN8864_c0_g1_i1.p1 TRINITY_DN8864_c0_g1~~TRINITY_DN8864_c0_g1_i1.p1  ORF type:complete len:312 (+),score=61.51 TRINITY_DN8864_c0_g1_i1:266-1201(+)
MSNARTKVVVCGTEATPLPLSKAKEHTHMWRAYVVGLGGEDISYYISKIVFQLHSSFPDPEIEITRPPFEIEKTGWGEFDLTILIHFVDPTVPVYEISHTLRLFSHQSVKTKNPIVYNEEYYDIEFRNVSSTFLAILDSRPPPPDYNNRPKLKYWKPQPEKEDRKIQYSSTTTSTLTTSSSNISSINSQEKQALDKLDLAHEAVKLKIQKLLFHYKTTRNYIKKVEADIQLLEQEENKANAGNLFRPVGGNIAGTSISTSGGYVYPHGGHMEYVGRSPIVTAIPTFTNINPNNFHPVMHHPTSSNLSAAPH